MFFIRKVKIKLKSEISLGQAKLIPRLAGARIGLKVPRYRERTQTG